MEFLLIIIACPVAILGGVWLFDFFQWFLPGQALVARIESFQSKKDKGFYLPVVSIENDTGGTILLETERIDQAIYMLSRPKIGDYTTVIVLSGEGEGIQSRARVFGYSYVIASVLCFLFLVTALSFALDNAQAFAQVLYIFIFAAVFGGGWVILKLIQSSDEA